MPVSGFPLDATAAGLRTGRLELHQLVDWVCARLRDSEARVQSLLPEDERETRLRQEAAALAGVWPEPVDRPPLFGVPVGVKDCIRADGHQTRAGSRLPPEAFAGPEAAVVARFRARGALVLGKTVTTEFTLGHPGPTRNPVDLNHTPGGSSSGSAAAVAAGFCPLAIGTQTGGSVIRPAAYCGVIGFKPTFGRIPTDGTVPYAPSLDHVGLFTQDAAGMTLAAAIACDGWRTEAVQAAGQILPVLGIPEGPYMDPVEPQALAVFDGTVSRLREAGYRVLKMPFPGNLEDIRNRRKDLALGELAMVHRVWFATHAPLYSDYTAERIRLGHRIDPARVASLRNALPADRSAVDAAIARAGVDLLISPAAPGPAPAGISATGSSVMNQPWTYTGNPVLSLPCGTLPGGKLPLGLQVIGRHGQDERLLGWATDMAGLIA